MASNSVAVVGVGQCSLDILGTLDRYPAVDSKAQLEETLIQGGGPVATALVTLARLGVTSAFVGRIGEDDFGRRIREGLTAEKVDSRYLLVDEKGSSQFSFIAVERDRGRRTIFCNPGSCQPLTGDDIPADLIRQSRLLHLDGSHPEGALTAAHLARKNGVTTVLDGGSWRTATEQLLPLVDHAVVSARFAAQMDPDRPLTEVLSLLMDYGCRSATVTDGENGSFTVDETGEVFHQPGFAVSAVDTTGCGDVFHGGYLYGLLQGWSLRRTARFAAACAALKTRALGGRTAIPTLSEIETLLTTNTDRCE